ncbi:MAG: hemerythrin domain-containing protein [Deltaproteobacteria bacterium]|nr:hemerythrin domain-containing protein [Deltaproteobacteria bacterium]
MDGTSSIVTPDAMVRTRGLETHFIVEHYHRAFDDEVALLGELIRKNWTGFRDVSSALAAFDVQLRAHHLLQEFRIFPAFENGRRAAPEQFEAWAADALRLFSALDALRAAIGLIDQRSPIARRLMRLMNEVQDHIVVEAKMLAPWTGL